MFSNQVIEDARLHAIETYPEESCGLVVDGVYVRCKNVHPDPKEHFRISPQKLAAAYKKGKVEALIHSHPDGPFYPSEADMAGQQGMQVPWGIIYSRPDSASIPIWFGDQCPIQPLEGRQFVHGVQDCFTLIRDWYRQEFGVALLDKPREDDWWAKPEHNQNYYLRYYQEAGFARVDDLQYGDVILMRIMSDTPNHGAIYVGGDSLLHHLAGRLSTREEGVMRWQKHIVGYFRHESQMNKDKDNAE